MSEITKEDFFKTKTSSYNGFLPIGVRMPEIKIEKRFYKELGISEEVDNYEFLRKLCHAGIKSKKINDRANKKDYYERAKYELETIKELGFVDYFLIVWDIIRYAKEAKIPFGAGRGSAAGSLILYLIDVTGIDPIEHNLFFERFISKQRAKPKGKIDGITFFDGGLMPDVDTDFSYDKRQKIIEYINEKYKGKTCKILNISTLATKACLKESCKIVGGYSEEEANKISDYVDKIHGVVRPLFKESEDENKKGIYQSNEKFRQWADTNKEIFDVALKLIELNKNYSVHASGVVISYYPVDEIMPIQKTKEGDLISGYDMRTVSEISLKFDALGLQTLGVIDDIIRQTGVDISKIDVNDPEIYRFFQNEDFNRLGIFQIEADTNYRVTQKVKPKSFDKLSAVIAIARPGALSYLDEYSKFSETGEPQSVHPFFDSILNTTGGLPLYQEQLMAMINKVGFSLDDSEQIRRCVGKKKIKEMEAWEEKIFEKCKDLEDGENIAKVLWKVANESASYSFNLSHSCSYANLSALTTYLKINYPKEFYCSLLKMTRHKQKPQEAISYIAQEMKNSGFKLFPPNLLKSEMDFSVENEGVRYGLLHIKKISDKSMENLNKFRKRDSENKVELFLIAKESGLNIGALSSLIQAGTLNDYQDSRCRLVLECQTFNILTDREKKFILQFSKDYDYDVLKIISVLRKEKKNMSDNKLFMPDKRFSTFKKKYDQFKLIYEQNKKKEKFANWFFENELLGYSYKYKLKECFSKPEIFTDLNDLKNKKNQEVKIVSRITSVKQKNSKNTGSKMLQLYISDETGNNLAILMDNKREKKLTNFLEFSKKPKKDDIAVITATVADSGTALFVNELSVLETKIFMSLRDLEV